MSDFPSGGDVQATRAWLDKEGFVDVFKEWKADAILGKSDEFVRSRFPKALEGQDQAEMLCGLLNTARQSTGNFTMLVSTTLIPHLLGRSINKFCVSVYVCPILYRVLSYIGFIFFLIFHYRDK